jgi:hypothetical protein
MKNIKFIAVLLLIGAVAFGFQTVSQAQSDTADAEVTIANQAVFIALGTTFTGSDVTAADIVAGLTAFTAATFDVDSTSPYQIDADTSLSGNTAAPAGALPAGIEDAACQVDIDNNGTFEDGDAVTALTGQAITTGGASTVHTMDLQIDWTQYTDAPSGNYTCSVRATVTEE